MSDSSTRAVARLRLALCAAPVLLFAHAALAVAPAATDAASTGLTDTFAHLGEHRVVARSVSLADLGLHDPLVLSAPDTRHELYLPVPAGLPIDNATLQIDGGYLHADGGRETMLVSLDGSPVLARGFVPPQGDAQASVGVDGSPRASGFVRVGLQWSSILDDRLCTDQTAIGNVLRVAPSSRLTYSFDPGAIADVRTAWSALPAAPVIAISGAHISDAAFDTAWRVDTLMEREGRRPVVRAWPKVGDTVEVDAAGVPAALRAVPAFAALAGGGSVKLADAAQVGAALVLASPTAFAPDIIVADDALRQQANAALDALRQQIAAASPDGAAAFDAWRTRAFAPITTPLAAGEIRIAHLPGQTTIVVGDRVAAQALVHDWRPIGVADRYVVHRLDDTPSPDVKRIALSALGGEPRTLDVLGRAMWDASFDLAAVAANGKLPDQLALDVAAAPTPRHDGNIASVYLNGVLIASKMLDGDGKPQRITAHVPRYALAPTNTLRVVFQRRPDGDCEARSQGYPVAILPTSHLTLARASTDDDFIGMLARFATAANVIVPAAYLDDATQAVSRVARLADVAGIAPTRATFSVVASGAAAAPSGPFLAMDVALQDEKAALAQLSNNRLTLVDQSGRVYADVSGLSNLAVLDVTHANGTTGIAYRTLGGAAPKVPSTLRLARGDVALVAKDGVVRLFDSRHPGEVVTDHAADDAFSRRLPWLIATGIVALLLALFVVAGVERRRHRAKGDAQ
ncbi:cellulose biosynthesis cyclic di-GMP-binding regulatory protein BcsB [Trinickia dinghuensis]|uniref:Cellulose synthase n=1 Tax=Trinickia dinghuensis TaxID=2291023 RepID=A0A3D8JZD3_9BURK|nr:cellulose biosynthesis cyclic di-GMP-binding regulatory protein BcsB [Trinickia dinghuensis]RDU98418.1 cellulose synthase [Trinickia dinghuensis]